MNNEILFDKLKPVYPMDTRKKIWFAKPSWINLPRRTFLIYQKKTHVYWLYITQRIIYTSFFGKTVAETSSRKQISLICNKFKPNNFKSKLFFFYLNKTVTSAYVSLPYKNEMHFVDLRNPRSSPTWWGYFMMY